MSASGGHQQSGIGADHTSVASGLWLEMNKTAHDLFGPYTPISVAMHSSDLLPHVACVQTVLQAPSELTQLSLPSLPVLPDPHSVMGILTLPRSYFEMGFVVASFTMRSGRYLPISTIDTDPSHCCGDDLSVPATLANLLHRERDALREIKQTILDSKRLQRSTTIEICVIEPLLVPGYGYTYRPEFLLQLQQLLRELGVLLVADETMSFVRCGAPLYSSTIADFTPDLVIIGKGLGCSVLLLSDTLSAAQNVIILFERAFSIIASPLALVQAACTLRVMHETKVAQRCRRQGEEMLQYLNQISGVRARGIGHCLWVDVGLHHLPIAACIRGRLLPRVDQTVATLRTIVAREAAITAQCAAVGELESMRIPSCAICGDQCRQNEPCFDCPPCTRQYHWACIAKPRDQATLLTACPCGYEFPTKRARRRNA